MARKKHEWHFHRCPDCFTVWGHKRPVDSKGVGWTMEKALARIAKEGRDGAYVKSHQCPNCKGEPVFPWARGPINPDLMRGMFFPMNEE